MKKVFVINDLKLTGGAEGAIRRIADEHSCPVYDLNSFNVKRRGLIRDLICLSRRNFHSMEVNTFLEYTTILFLCLRILIRDLRVNVWVRTSVNHSFGRLNRVVYRFLIGYSDHIYFQNECQRDSFLRTYKIPEKVTTTIYRERREYPTVIPPNVLKDCFMFAGRLEREKGILEIIQWAIARDCRLLIYGYGTLEGVVLKEIENHDKISFHGKYSSFFNLPIYGALILNSAYEGNPNILDEGLHLGLPIYCRRYDECVVEQYQDMGIVFFDKIMDI